ncbi:MAG: hypothetical protein H6739_31145 [Alphaproteobacteria bacterium]|nr:hypothetical protein [Alphaproteobacteria bacterium]
MSLLLAAALALSPARADPPVLGGGAVGGDDKDDTGPAPDVVVVPPVVVEAQQEADTSDDYEPQAFLFARPAAMTALGEGTGKFDEPGTVEDFAFALGDFFTESGTLAAGGAVEVGLRTLGLTRNMDATEYLESWGRRRLSHTYLSLASSRRVVTDATDDVLMSAGLRTVLIHGGDVLLDQHYRDAVERTNVECFRRSREAEAKGNADFNPVACRERLYAEYARDIPEPDWNAGGLVLSGAYTGAWIGGRYTGFQSESVSGWLTGVAPLQEWGQVGLSLSWTQSLTEEPDVAGVTTRFRAALDGARLTTELGYLMGLVDPSAGLLDHRGRVVVGGEFQVQGRSWIHGEVGLEVAPQQDLVTLLSGASFRWGQASEATFGGAPAPEAADEPDEDEASEDTPPSDAPPSDAPAEAPGPTLPVPAPVPGG